MVEPGELIRFDNLKNSLFRSLNENGILMVTLRCTKDSSQEKINWKKEGFVPVFDGACYLDGVSCIGPMGQIGPILLITDLSILQPAEQSMQYRLAVLFVDCFG